MDHAYTDTLTGASGNVDVTDSMPDPSSLIIGTQYLRSLSLDVQNTPDVYREIPAQPHLAMMVDVTGRQLDEHATFEVSLVIRASGLESAPTDGEPQPKALYTVSIAYGGLFGLTGRIPQDAIEPLLLVEAPRFLFPSARAALLNAIREAGFPAPSIQALDFHALWQSRRSR